MTWCWLRVTHHCLHVTYLITGIIIATLRSRSYYYPHFTGDKTETQSGEVTVLIHSSCNKKIPQTEWLTNNRNPFPIVLEAEKSQTTAQANVMPGEGPLPGSKTDTVFSVCPHAAEGMREHSQASFKRALIQLKGVSPSWPNYSPNAPPPKTITFRVGISMCEF